MVTITNSKKLRRAVAIIAAASLIFDLVGCAAKAGESVEITVHEQTKGSVRLKAPARLILKLPAQVSTGFIWTANEPVHLCAMHEGKMEDASSNSDANINYQVFELTCSHTGTTSVAFDYAREANSPPIKHYVLTVEIY